MSDLSTHLRQSPTDGPGLLHSQVQRKVLLVLVVFARVVPGLLVKDGEDAGDGFSDGVAIVAMERRGVSHS